MTQPFICLSLAFSALAVLGSAAAVAQDLQLFEPMDLEADAQSAPLMTDQPGFVSNGQPAYTLRSLSRFGAQYQAILINRAGEISKLAWQEGESPQILNSGGFTVASVGPSSLSLQHPPGDACVAAITSGVTCVTGDRSELRLTVAAPLPPTVAAIPMQPGGPFSEGQMGPMPVDPAMEPQPDQVFINPFSGEAEVMPQVSEQERADRMARQQLRAERLRQFEQSALIDDADIPPGMQRVRTPFGDRLVPVRE
ncbi:MAG: hypothetical protein RLZZ227_2147 [Pseudomonadota bacterium]